jgi:hypothetical protein
VKSFDPVKKFWPGENVFIKCSHLDVNKQGTLFKLSIHGKGNWQSMPRGRNAKPTNRPPTPRTQWNKPWVSSSPSSTRDPW